MSDLASFFSNSTASATTAVADGSHNGTASGGAVESAQSVRVQEMVKRVPVTSLIVSALSSLLEVKPPVKLPREAAS